MAGGPKINEILFIDSDFAELFGLSENTATSSFTGDASQATISKVSTAELYAGDGNNTPPDIRPHLRDLTSNRWVLLDSGATASVYPKALVTGAVPDAVPALKAANGTPMATYGKKVVKIRVGNNLHIAVDCFIADIKNPILGWDWMFANDIEVRHRYVKGVGRKYYLPVQGRKVYLSMAKPKAEVSIHAVDAVAIAATRDSYQLWAQQQLVKSTTAAAKQSVPQRYQRLLEDFPDIGSPNFKAQPLTNHTIETGDSKPCTAKVRPLAKGSRKHDLGSRQKTGAAAVPAPSGGLPGYWQSQLQSPAAHQPHHRDRREQAMHSQGQTLGQGQPEARSWQEGTGRVSPARSRPETSQ